MILSTCKNRFEAFQANASEFCIHLLNLDNSGTGVRLYFHVHLDGPLYFRSTSNERIIRFDLRGKSPKLVVKKLNTLFAYMPGEVSPTFYEDGFSFVGE